MSGKGKARTLLTPVIRGEISLSDGSEVSFWKEILTETTIDYKGEQITFDDEYLKDLATAFADGAYDQTPFLLANKDNEHTMDPERFRGNVKELKVGGPSGEPGLWGKIQFPSKEAAQAVIDNPDLGVSARIKEDVRKADGRNYKRAMVHVLGTLDPVVTGMSPWRQVELSESDSDSVIVDLTGSEFQKGKKMGSSIKSTDKVEDFDFSETSDEELLALLADAEPEDDDDDDEEDSDDESEDDDDDEEEVELSVSTRRAIDLANARSAAADEKANDALRRAAKAEWAAERGALLKAGVSPADIDLCEPILNRPNPMVIDLSNTDGKGVVLDVAKIVRQLLKNHEGDVDLSVEAGHSGSESGDKDPDEDLLTLWSEQFKD